jgi:hypothetical protein
MTTRPPELSMDAKWEAAIDLTLRRLVYGSLAGGAAGLMLFRASPLPAPPRRSRPRVAPPARADRSDHPPTLLLSSQAARELARRA